jgi:DNA polymerase
VSQAPEDPSHLIAMAKLLLSEAVEEGLDHVEIDKISESDTSPGDTAPLAVKPSGATLESVRETLGDCQRCPLCEERKKIVFGDGNPEADLMFIGEGPGANEDEQGLPFVGRAGDLLTQMIEKGMGLPREEVYICNIVKCRPPGNRNPLPQEVAACRPFLDGQIDAVRPKVIVSLGKPATGLLLDREVAITRIRGTWHDYKGIALMPTLHPAFVLRQYTDENRRAVWQDLQAALARIREE